MSKNLRLGIVIGAFLVCCVYEVGTYAEETQRAITIAILPCSDPVSVFKKFHSLATYLNRETGFDVKLVVPKDPGEFEFAIKAGNIDFALQGPHTYVRLAEWYHKDALITALTMDRKTCESGVLIVRKDSSIKKIRDLKGRSVLFGPRLSATKWVAAKLLLEDNGLDIDRDLQDYLNGGCCEDIAFNVYLKIVDAGVVCDHFVTKHPDKPLELGIDMEHLVVIAKNKPVPTRIFSALRYVGNDIVSAVNDALLKLDIREPAYRDILGPAEVSAFMRAKDHEYDGMRMLVGMENSK